MAVSPEQVLQVLRSVYDPEIPLNIVDLGLVYDVKVRPAMASASELAGPSAPAEEVGIDMTLTSQGCPSHVSIEMAVRRAVEEIPGIQRATVNWVWQPAWGPERISAEGREKLGIDV